MLRKVKEMKSAIYSSKNKNPNEETKRRVSNSQHQNHRDDPQHTKHEARSTHTCSFSPRQPDTRHQCQHNLQQQQDDALSRPTSSSGPDHDPSNQTRSEQHSSVKLRSFAVQVIERAEREEGSSSVVEFGTWDGSESEEQVGGDGEADEDEGEDGEDEG